MRELHHTKEEFMVFLRKDEEETGLSKNGIGGKEARNLKSTVS